MQTLYSSSIITPIGKLQAISDDQDLILLLFSENSSLQKNISKLQKSYRLVVEKNKIIAQVEEELIAYFAGTLRQFTIPTKITGTPFQQLCWQALQKIPYGLTTNYARQAQLINNPKAHRAVANANKQNLIAIIYPCHRIIKSDGKLCGYNGGVDKKEKLLALEKRYLHA